MEEHKEVEIDNVVIEEKETIDDFIEEEPEEFRYSITSYGVDYTVDRLVNRLQNGKIIIPKFQRNYVWNINEASRFIESLILGLPVPGVFFTQEKETGRMLVIDGQQRLTSLQKFYEGLFNEKKAFTLKNVQSDLEGKSIKTISSTDRTRLDDCVIHATVIKQDSPNDDGSSIYMVFERLNTGGMKLMPQEIRACIYHGNFNELLNELANYPNWKFIYGSENLRLKSEELILRFFALSENWNSYKKGLKSFLNSYMETNKNLSAEKYNQLSTKFKSTVNKIYENLGPQAMRIGRNLNAAIFDSVMIATETLLNNTTHPNWELYKIKYNELLENENYKKCVQSTTSSEDAVKGRINIALQTLCQ